MKQEIKLPISKFIKTFLYIFFSKKKYIKIATINKTTKYGEGICFEKKENVKKIGTKIQKKFFFNKIPSEIEKIAMTQKITA